VTLRRTPLARGTKPLARRTELQRVRWVPKPKPRPGWVSARALCRERAGSCCERCGQWAPNGHAHHRLSRARGGEDELSNLMWLCGPGCHRWVHENPAAATAAGWLRSASGDDTQ
jgi:hypothetical protein